MRLVTDLMQGPEGPLTLVARDGALAGIYFQPHRPGGPPAAPRDPSEPVLQAARAALEAYFQGRRTTFDLPIDPAGTAFQTTVWAALRRIAFGDVTTYGAIAAEIGKPAAVRAVAGAVARNPISIIIPCHRVIGADGRLTGYAGGLDWKRRLLAIEQGGAFTAAGDHAARI